ncbi:acyl carrier protein [Streptomyces arenae]|nr:acyl carrier protein [Streptomyces arenae]
MIYKAVADLLVSAFEVPQEKLRADASLEQLGLDSLAQVELAERLAEAFDIDIPEEAVTATTTPGGLAETIGRRREVSR